MKRISTKKKNNKRPAPRVNDVLDLRQPQKTPKRMHLLQQKNNEVNRLTIIVLVFLAVIVGIFFYQRWQNNQGNGSLADVTTKVGKLMLLPKDEQPTLATVEDKTVLKDKFLASHTENGDKVLIYAKNRMVIVYRPAIKKIAAVGSVTADLALPEAKGASLTILDGAGNPTKTQKLTKAIKTAYPSIEIIDGGKTTRQDFPSTIVIDNTEKKDNLLFALVDVVAGQRGVLPTGVERTATDLMIIVGKD